MTKPTDNAISTAIITARDSLNAKNWHKGLYFSTNKKKCLRMCAHGALQAQVNPDVKLAIANFPYFSDRAASAAVRAVVIATAIAADRAAAATQAASAAAAAAAPAAVAADDAADRAASADAAAAAEFAADSRCTRSAWFKSECWDNRPLWIRSSHLDAHWVLGLVGLTAKFNDAPTTTVRSVKKKFTEAAQLARKLCNGAT